MNEMLLLMRNINEMLNVEIVFFANYIFSLSFGFFVVVLLHRVVHIDINSYEIIIWK